jgi:hypothetical protein
MIRKRRPEEPTIINLDGPDGNAYVLMSILSRSFKMSGLDPKNALEEMRSGDYPNLLRVFDRYCGGTFTLVTEDQKLLNALNSTSN